MLDEPFNVLDISTISRDSFLDDMQDLYRAKKVNKDMSTNNLLDLKEDKKGLEKAGSAFESIFMNLILKEMKKTVHSEDGILPESSDQKLFQEMLDEEVTKKLGERGELGIKDAVVRTYGDRFNKKEDQSSVINTLA